MLKDFGTEVGFGGVIRVCRVPIGRVNKVMPNKAASSSAWACEFPSPKVIEKWMKVVEKRPRTVLVETCSAVP